MSTSGRRRHVSTQMHTHPWKAWHFTANTPINTGFQQDSPGSYKLLADTVEGKDSRPSSEHCWIPLSLLLTIFKKKKKKASD